MIRRNQDNLSVFFLRRILFLFFCLLLFSGNAFPQYTLRLKIAGLPSLHQSDILFAAGNFNNWVPGDSAFRFEKSGDHFMLEITGLGKGNYEFKITRGEWEKVEVAATGKDISNRFVNLLSDTTIVLHVEAWHDDQPGMQKIHTASASVHVLDSAFYMPQLDRSRRIWIYLPPGYTTNGKRYPVIYMTDGQNLFDEYYAFKEEWGIDEFLDSVSNEKKQSAIVVGIENGVNRVNEYNPYNDSTYGNGEGEKYLSFLVETLKPYVDKHYRTLKSPGSSIIAGSSVGALIAYYATLRYPGVFGKCGIFSPAFWIAPQIKAVTDSLSANQSGQFFFYAGESESKTMLQDMQAVAGLLGSGSKAIIYQVTDPEGQHNEKSWRKWFGEFYAWITGNGLSYQVNPAN